MLRHLNVDLLCVPDAWDVEPQTFGKETDGQVTLARARAEICRWRFDLEPVARVAEMFDRLPAAEKAKSVYPAPERRAPVQDRRLHRRQEHGGDGRERRIPLHMNQDARRLADHDPQLDHRQRRRSTTGASAQYRPLPDARRRSLTTPPSTAWWRSATAFAPTPTAHPAHPRRPDRDLRPRPRATRPSTCS